MCRLSVKDYIFNPNFKDPYKLFIHNDNEMLQVSPDFSVKCPYKGGSPGLVVMGVDSRFKGRGFESQRRILDGHDIFHIHLL